MHIIETIQSHPLTGLIAELTEEYPDRVERARAFYKEKVKRAFDASTTILAHGPYHRGRSAMDALDAPEVKPFLAEATLGRFESARSIGEQAMVRMWTADPSGAVSPQEWWRNLLDFEYMVLLQLATDGIARQSARPLRSPSANIRTYSWSVIELKESLQKKDFQAAGFKPGPEAASVTLLFSRDPANRIHVCEVSVEESSIFRAVNSVRKIEEIAAEAGGEPRAVQTVLAELAKVGAVSM